MSIDTTEHYVERTDGRVYYDTAHQSSPREFIREVMDFLQQ